MFWTLLLINGSCTTFWLLQKFDSYCLTTFQIYITVKEIVAIKFTVFCLFFQYYFYNCLPIWPFFSIIHKGISDSRMETLMFRELQHQWWLDWPLTSVFQWHSIYKLLQGNIIFKICNYVFEISIVPKYVTIIMYSMFSEFIKTSPSFVVAQSWDCKRPFHYKVFKRLLHHVNITSL